MQLSFIKTSRMANKPVQVTLFAALMLSSAMALAQEQTSPKITTAKGPVFAVKGFVISGDNPLSSGEGEGILAPFVRSDATLSSLQQAAAALESVLKARGFNLYRVVLPPQEVGGTIRLNLVKFVLEKITVEGIQTYSQANIRASLPELREGEAPNFKLLAVQTAIANESPSKQIQIGIKESQEADRIDARILVKEGKPWHFSVGLNNTGSKATGDDRLTLTGGHHNLFDRDQQLTAAYTTSIANTSNVSQLGLNYRIPLYRQGGVIGLSHTQSDVLGDFGAFKTSGVGKTFGANYATYLPPVAGRRTYLSVGLEDKQFNATEINGIAVPGQQLRRSRPLTVSYNARQETDNWLLNYNTDLAFNLASGTGNDLAAYQSEDPRISKVRWRALRGSANFSSALQRGWLLELRSQAQYSPDALISGEQFGLGGAHSVRGTTERPISGDSGLSFSAELTTPEISQGWRMLGFFDGGWLYNHKANLIKPAQDSLASLGFGLRYNTPKLTLSLDFGRLIIGSKPLLLSGLMLPKAGDERLHLQLTASF